MQISIAARIVKLVDHPNLLLDQAIVWEFELLFNPRLNQLLPGWQQFRADDRARIASLGLPYIPGNEGQHLLLLATGSYTVNRGQVTLTAAREFELKEDRLNGLTGSLEEYNEMASELPKSTLFLYREHSSCPSGMYTF